VSSVFGKNTHFGAAAQKQGGSSKAKGDDAGFEYGRKRGKAFLGCYWGVGGGEINQMRKFTQEFWRLVYL